MLARLIPLVLLSLAQAPAPAESPTASPPVEITATILTRDGRPPGAVRAADLELREDGTPQTILSVTPRADAPRRIAIVLDEFHVGADAAPAVRSAVHAFVDNYLRDGDRAVVLKPLDSLPAIHLTGDRDRLHEAIDSFEGRKGNYAARTPLEAETIGKMPALAEYSRAQVVLSALRALASRLGGMPGRTAIVLVSEGFVRDTRGPSANVLPDAGTVQRFANRFDVPIYTLAPVAAPPADDPAEEMLRVLSAQTGGAFRASLDLAPGLRQVAEELGGGYVITYRPPHDADGRFHEIRVTIRRKDASVRTRAGYISPLPASLRAARRPAPDPFFSSRLLHRSAFIDVWSGITQVDASDGRVVVTWEPGHPRIGSGRSSAARVSVTAAKPDGTVLFQGVVAPLRSTIAGVLDRAEFSAPTGRVQLDMTIFGARGEKLDVDTRDIEVPALGPGTLLLAPILLPARSARERRELLSDDHPAPDPSREFSRTERLLIRVPAYSAAGQPRVTARLLNRIGQTVVEIEEMPDRPGGLAQFDLPLAPLAPGDYVLEISATGPNGKAAQRIDLRITG